MLDQTNRKFDKICIIPISFFPFLPFISIFLFALILFSQYNSGKRIFYTFFFLLALYLGMINSTKVPESDLINYIDSYRNVKDSSFINYILIAGKEPAFFILNYIIFNLTGGSISLYLIIITSFSYFLFFIAIYKYFKAIKNNQHAIIFAILMAAFFPQLFSLSAHVMRQFLAASVVTYAIVQKIFYNKRVWPLLLLAVFIHSTAIFFVPLLYWGIFKKRISIKSIGVLLILILIVGKLLPFLTNIIQNKFGDNFLSYIFLRAVTANSLELEELSLLPFLVMGLLIMIILWVQHKKRNFFLSDSNKGIVHLGNIFLMFCAFILANLDQQELSLRFFFYIYFFFPLIFPLIFLAKTQELNFLRLSVSMLMILFFVFRLEYGTWQYTSLPQLLFGSVFEFYV